MRNVVYVSGTRADYGLMRGVLAAIDQHPELRLSILVTGMHLLQDFGYTLSDIESDGYNISARVSMQLGEDSPAAMAKSLGIGLIGMTQAFEEVQPDIILLEGDRGESLAAAIAAGHMGIAIAHMSGGDVTAGAIDESIRHAISKFSHIHFPGTDLSARRLLAMGEREENVIMVGTPGCDLLAELDISPGQVAEELSLDLEQPVIVVLQHPETAGAEQQAGSQMRETMESVSALGYRTILIYPNSDAGGRDMIKVIQEYESLSFLSVYKSLPRDLYVGLLSVASVMIGNSSSSLTDAPNFGLPAINVGVRQAQRERGGNIIDVTHDRTEIKNKIEESIRRLDDPDFRSECRETPYKDVDTGGKVAAVLASVALGPILTQKAFCDHWLGGTGGKDSIGDTPS
jgi:GDP/UDP-N,N'-diacetylbacillosamine 2-epimerase (hydrolysing)